MELDKALEELGQMGPYQMKCYALLILSIGFSAYYSMTYAFTARDLNYRCFIPECEKEGGPYQVDWLNHGVPVSSGGTLDKCNYYRPISNNDTCTFDTAQTIRCHKYVLEDKLRTSIVSTFNIYCEDNWKLAFFGTMNNVGQFLGLPLVGYISDRYGRKVMLVASLLSSAVVGIIKSFSPNYWSFVFLEVLDAACGDGTYSGSFIMAAELTSPKTRVVATTVMSSAYTLGEVALGLAAWYTLDWRNFLRVIYTPALLFIIYIWILPESMRWLLAKGKGKKAMEILDKISASNKKPLSQETREIIKNKMIENDKNGEENGTPIGEIIKSPQMLMRLINCSFTWITHTLLFYGLSLNSVTVAGNMYVNFIWVCLAELPGYVLAALTMDSTGRRLSLSGALAVSGISCLISHFVPKDLPNVSMALFFIGKCAITMSFTVLYVYTAEMFPTNLRHSLLGFCSTFGRIGSMIAPQAPLMAKYVDPMIVFGVTALTAASLSLFFPETVNQSLPDNVNQAMAMDKKVAYA